VSASAQTFTINGDDDASWRGNTRYNSSGTYFGLFTKGGGTSDRAYVEFSLPTVPIGYELVSADLLLYNYWGTPQGKTVNYDIRIRGTEMDFDENNNTAPSGTAHENWDIAVNSFHVDSTPRLYTLDITSFFDQYQGKTVTFSIRALSGSGDGPFFVDKEGTNGQSTANRPRIKYTIAEIPPVPEPTSMLALALGFGALVARRRK
jgi:hypothetical protein